MSRLMSHILLAILMLPLATVVYVISGIIAVGMIEGLMPRSIGEEVIIFLFAGAVTWGFIAVYWWSLWRRSVRWNTMRTSGTLIAFVAAAVAATIVALGVGWAADELGLFIGSILAPLLWLVGTIFVWRESAAERAERLTSSARTGVVCPSCGYNLTGLNSTRCPECGTQYTLDELLAAQPGQKDAEIVG